MKIIIIVFTVFLNFLLVACNDSTEYSATSMADDGKEIDYWVAPMDANYRRDKPGKSPMGMDLVPIYMQTGDDAGAVIISPAMGAAVVDPCSPCSTRTETAITGSLAGA